ncbi:MAG: hypothetical protein ABI554_07785 [Flavobacterium sp.]
MQKYILMLLLLFFINAVQSQEKSIAITDAALKESIYNQYKKEVLNYSMKEFEYLFFEFSDKKHQENLILTKEEFYTYTVKIAIFSDRLAALYPKEKEAAEASKKQWMSESYQDYLLSKQAVQK